MFRGILRSQEEFIKNFRRKFRSFWNDTKIEKESYWSTKPEITRKLKMDRSGCELFRQPTTLKINLSFAIHFSFEIEHEWNCIYYTLMLRGNI